MSYEDLKPLLENCTPGVFEAKNGFIKSGPKIIMRAGVYSLGRDVSIRKNFEISSNEAKYNLELVCRSVNYVKENHEDVLQGLKDLRSQAIDGGAAETSIFVRCFDNLIKKATI